MEQGLEKTPPILDRVFLDQAIVVGLGSNLAGAWIDSEALLEAALTRLGEVGFRLGARSSWWSSKAWPDPSDPPFINGVALFDADRPARETLSRLLKVEQEFDRIRRAANAPRTLDLDLIAQGRTVIDEGDLVLPHPKAHERRFVMAPLAEATPEWRHPTLNETAEALARRAVIGADARPLSRAALHKTPRTAI